MKDFLIYILFRLLIFIGKTIPSRSFEYFVYRMLKLLSYRESVISRNIDSAFPEKDSKYKNNIKHQYYRHLGRVAAYTLKPNSVFNFNNTEILKNCSSNDGIILLSGHYGNWEQVAHALGESLKIKGYGVYKPLSNKYINEYIIQTRTSDFGEPIPKEHLVKHLIKNRGQKPVYYLIIDQRPTEEQIVFKTQFLNQETFFNNSIQKLSDKFELDFIYLSAIPTERGYDITLHKLDTTSQLIPQYVRYLESDIKNAPSYYLWSHDRWKYVKYQKFS